MFNSDPDEIMIRYGLCTFCIGRGCPMCEGTGEHEDHDERKEKYNTCRLNRRN